jgi:hypothetical protein
VLAQRCAASKKIPRPPATKALCALPNARRPRRTALVPPPLPIPNPHALPHPVCASAYALPHQVVRLPNALPHPVCLCPFLQTCLVPPAYCPKAGCVACLVPPRLLPKSGLCHALLDPSSTLPSTPRLIVRTESRQLHPIFPRKTARATRLVVRTESRQLHPHPLFPRNGTCSETCCTYRKSRRPGAPFPHAVRARCESRLRDTPTDETPKLASEG